MVQEVYPGSDMEGGRALREYLHGKKVDTPFAITDQQKKVIYTAYQAWASQLFDDLEDKSILSAEELVYKVLSITEKVLERGSWAESKEPVFIVK